MSARLPAGTIKERADGSVWLKPSSTAKEWKQLAAGTGGAGVKPTAELPGLFGHGQRQPKDVNSAWSEIQTRYQLDGHLPPPEVHPQNANIDAEGDIDSKPVISWTSPEGRDRRTYTQRFHWNRFASIHEAAKGSYADIERKISALDAQFNGESGEAAMAAYIHLKTGQPIEAIVGMHAQHGHVAREMTPTKTAPVAKGDRASLLTKILHATIALRDRTQLFHWNVVGPNFPALHHLFEKQYDALGNAVDDIAERIRALGETVSVAVPETREFPESAQAMLVELAASHTALRKLCETAVGQAEADGDAATVDLLGKRCLDHDKAAWMLRATADVPDDDCECEGCADCRDDEEDEEVTKGGQGVPEEYNKPRRIQQGEPGYGKKKFVVHARNASGKTRVIRFGDANMEIKRDDPERRANFRARHNCDSATDILSARYWSCKQWRAKEKVAKGGHTADRHHPDRAHFLLTHAKGHAYTTSVHHPAIANHVHARKQEGEGPLFRASVDQVRAALSTAGFVDGDARVVEHHNIAMMAADFLSKTPSNVLKKGGVGLARVYLTEASNHIAEHYGHAPAPRGMSYVPPDIAAAYLEDLGAGAQYPTAFAGLRGESHRQAAKKVVQKAFGTVEGYEDKVEEITDRLIKTDKRIRKGDPCSLLEVEQFLGLPAPISSLGLEKPSSTKTTEEPKSTTPSQSSASSELSTKAPLLDSVLEKAESYLARLAPGTDERRARYVYDREALTMLLAHESAAQLFVPGTRFEFAYPSDHNTHCPGYVDIDDRISNLVTARHTGTGKTFMINVQDLRKLLHVYHSTHTTTVQSGLNEMPEMEVGPIGKSHAASLGEDRPSVGFVLSDIGSRKPEHQMVEELAKEAYLVALRRSVEGDIDFDQMKLITMAMMDRDYAKMLRLCKGAGGVSQSGPPPTTSSSGTVDSAGAVTGRHPGPQGLPIGSETRRKDGIYRKDAEHKWSRVTDHSGHDHKKEPNSEATGSFDSATLDDLRSRLSKLRTALRSASGKERNKIISEITKVKAKIKKLNLSSRGKSEAAQKAQDSLRDITDVLDHLDDPIEQWLAKAQNERLEALDAFIRESDGDYIDFGADLAYAPPSVRAQAHQLRLFAGSGALQERFYLVKAKVR